MIAVLIPAHNEADLIGKCLGSVIRASTQPALGGEEVRIVVALDRCTDDTGRIARDCGATTVETSGGNVGAARAAAARLAVSAGARWLACTDADTCVPMDWLSAQVMCGADAFCGVVTVDDWSGYLTGMREAFLGPHDLVDDHPHVHGANMGVSTAAYLSVGGFPEIACSEDVGLVERLVLGGYRVARRARPSVVTSPRRDARARGGFGDYLLAMETRLRVASRPETDLEPHSVTTSV